MPPENVRRAADAAEEPLASLLAAHVVVVAGKGGVGKTTVTAVLARAAADRGRRVLVVELDGKSTLASLVPDVEVRTIAAAAALEEYLHDHGFARIARRLSATGVIDVVGTAAPGIDDVVVLGKVKHLERSGEWDVILVDGPAAGHAITFLTSAAGLADAVQSGPVRAQSTDVLEMLQDPRRCQVVLVTMPEATPVNEVIETAFALEDVAGVQLGPVVVNAVDPVMYATVDGGADLVDPDAFDAGDLGADAGEARALVDAARFRRARAEVERVELDRLAESLPLVQVRIPQLPVAGLGAADIEVLAAGLRTGRAR